MKKYSFAFAPFVITAFMVFAHSFVLHGRLKICYELETDQSGVSKLYWSGGRGFNESQSVSKRVQAGKIQNICLQHPNFRDVREIRIDPIDRETKFHVDRAYIERTDLMFPWQNLTRSEVGIKNRFESHDVISIEEGEAGGFLALTNDPFLIWEMEDKPFRLRKVVILNYVTVIFFLLAGFWLLTILLRRKGDIKPNGLASGLLVFLLYPVFFVVAWFVLDYGDLFRYSQFIIFLSIGVFFAYSVGISAGVLNRVASVYLPIMVSVVLIIMLDLSVRAGLVDSALFTKPLNEPYHWSANRRAEDNLVRSSVLYEEDFRQLGSRVVPASRFLGDVPTSYYTAAAMDLYPVVAHQHHRDWVHIYSRTMDFLCRNANPDRFVDHLRVQEKRLKRRGLPPPKYLIIVRDPENPHIMNSCVNREYERVVATLEGTLPMVFEGEFVRAYELRY